MKRPSLEEVREYFKNAEKCVSIQGSKFKNPKDFRYAVIRKEDKSIYTDDGGYEVWSKEKGYAKILTYKNKDIKITKENIIKLDKKETTVRELFPDVFKTELVVDKWYKSLDNPKMIIFVIDFIDVQKIRAYGFNTDGVWDDDDCRTSWGLPSDGNFREATESEVFEALKNEAVKRYKDGDFVHSLVHDKILQIKDSRTEAMYISTYDKFHFGSDGSSCVVVFQKGQWAEIIPTITKEEAEKLLNKKII